jgi:ABC-type transporter Mla subunit MlaD
VIRKLAMVAVVGAVCFAAFVLTGANEEPGGRTITIPFDNAFGLTEGGDLRVGGVKAGSTESFDIAKGKICESAKNQGGPPRTCALVKAKVTEKGFSSFREDASCAIRQQSLIGEYYVDCQPGQSKQPLVNNTLSIDRTESTIPADLVANVMRRPYRERLRLIIAELGTGLAGRPQDLAELLQKAHPGLRETSKTLNILAAQTTTIKNFISDSDTVVADLEHNKREVARWVDSAEKAAAISADKGQDIEAGFQRLPRFLDELRPTMTALGDLTDKQTPLLQNLQRSAPALNETFTLLGPFANASRPSLRSLGDASDKGTRALRASADEINELRKLAANAPGLGKPLRQLLQTADDRSRGRPDSRYSESAPPSPDPTSVAKSKGKGFTAFEDLLNYVYWQSLAINEFDSIGHQLRVLLLVGSECASYANAEIAKNKDRRDHCNAYLGPYQPGVTSPDPTEDGGPDSAAEEKRAKKLKRSSRRHAGDPEAPPTPGQPDPSVPHTVLPPEVQQAIDGVTNALPHVTTPQTPATPAPPTTPNQSPTDQLLDFLLGQ